MLDLSTESPLSLKEAARLPQLRTKGKARHFSCLFRWVATGARDSNGNRVKLETVRTPAGMVTTTEAVNRFLAALNGETVKPSQTAVNPAADSAMRELAGMGIG